MKTLLQFIAGAIAIANVLGLPLRAAAQSLPSGSTGASAPMPARAALPYTSAFADYKPYSDIKTGDWKALNQAVGDAAAPHAGHGMEMRPAAQPAPQAPTHSGHSTDGGKK